MSRLHRVLIADDHALVAEGLSRLLQTEYEVVGIAVNGRALVADAARLRPDLAVLDIGMPELNGIEAARQINRIDANMRMVFVTQQVDLEYLRAALRTGALGYVAKQSASQELLTAMRMALLGRRYITPLLADAYQRSSGPGSSHADEVLTPRQREVLQMVAEGRTVKEISANLQISPKTVEFHKHALMNELGLRTTAELTRYALSQRIVFD